MTLTITPETGAAVLDYLAEQIAAGSRSAREFVDHAVRVAGNYKDAPAAAAVVRSHLDRIAHTPAERRYVLDLCDHAADNALDLINWASILQSPPEFLGIKVSPGVEPPKGESGALGHTPRLTTDTHGTLFVRLGGKPNPDDLNDVIEDHIYNPPQLVREVVRLRTRGFVIVDTLEECFILTEEEFAAQV